jgi:hypothetical protein
VEGQGPTGDAATDEAYDGLGSTFDLYWNIFQRNSIDNAGMNMLGSVHYLQGYDNAFWNGTQIVFGDGDGTYFNRFTIAVDVIGHELTHGVTAHQANLVYHDQPGALNESISDVFGSLVKQYSHSPPPDRGPGRLADRRGPLHGGGAWRGATLDEGAGHGVRRSASREGPPAGPHEPLRHDDQ